MLLQGLSPSPRANRISPPQFLPSNNAKLMIFSAHEDYRLADLEMARMHMQSSYAGPITQFINSGKLT